MSERFFNDPILNSPYERPSRHWELVMAIPTQRDLPGRRESRLITPIPRPKKRGGKGEQTLTSKQSRQWRAANPTYRPGMYSRMKK